MQTGKYSHFELLPVEMIYEICFFLAVTEVYKLKSISETFEKAISTMLMGTPFLVNKGNIGFAIKKTYECPSSTRSLEELTLNGTRACNKILDKNFSYFKQRYTVFSLSTKTTFFASIGRWMPPIEFSMEDLQPILAEDDAQKLFKQITRVGNIYPYILNILKGKGKEFNIQLACNELRTELLDKNPVLIDCAFIGLIPITMMWNAVKSFDVLIQAYIIFSITYNNVLKQEYYRLSSIINMISIYNSLINKNKNNHENYFISRFLKIALQSYSPETHLDILLQIIEWFCLNNYTTLVVQILNTLSRRDRFALIDKWQNNEYYSPLLDDEIFSELKKQLFENKLSEKLIDELKKITSDMECLLQNDGKFTKEYLQSKLERVDGAISNVIDSIDPDRSQSNGHLEPNQSDSDSESESDYDEVDYWMHVKYPEFLDSYPDDESDSENRGRISPTP